MEHMYHGRQKTQNYKEINKREKKMENITRQGKARQGKTGWDTIGQYKGDGDDNRI